MIAIIRISGQIGMKMKEKETLERLGLRKKYSCVIVNENPDNLGMLNRIKNFVAFGKIDEKTLIELIKARGKQIGKRNAKVENPEKIAKEIIAGKSASELGMKPWFGLHPARGGIETKQHYPKGVLGNHNEKINELIMRML